MTDEEIDCNFSPHPAEERRECLHDDVNIAVRALAKHLNVVLPESDEKKVALHRLQEVMFWSNAAIARHC